MDIRGILAAVESHAAATGRFDAIRRFEPRNPGAGHEPTNVPGYGLTCAVWMESIAPTRRSGLTSASVRMIVNVRLYRSMLTDPLDVVDPEMVDAVNDLITAYAGDFTLDGLVRAVDILGGEGDIRLSAQAGYLQEDEVVYRIYTISVPLVLNDVWTYTP